MLKRFSWNRLRVLILLGIDKSFAYFDKNDCLIINFIFHQYSTLLKSNGKGILWNPWDEKEQIYSLVMPHDIQIKIQELLKIHKKSILINKNLN